jgi:hypothetical protein
MAESFPLSWPAGWSRTKLQTNSAFKAPMSKAVALLRNEVRRMGGSSVVISTNIPLKADGTMRMDREPVDSGVAVYFTRNGKQVVFACDKYDLARENVYAIARTIEAMRSIERWGASEMMERAFSGFKALPETASEGEDCWKVLMLPPMSDARLVKLAHRDIIRNLHATGASSEDFARINVSRDECLRALNAALKGETT